MNRLITYFHDINFLRFLDVHNSIYKYQNNKLEFKLRKKSNVACITKRNK